MAKKWVIGGLAVGVGALVLAPEARTWLRRRLGLEPEDRRWFEEEGVENAEHEGDEPLDTREARFSLRARLAEEGHAAPAGRGAVRGRRARTRAVRVPRVPVRSRAARVPRVRAAGPRAVARTRGAGRGGARRGCARRRGARSRRRAASPSRARAAPDLAVRRPGSAPAALRRGARAPARRRVLLVRGRAGDHARGGRAPRAGRGHERDRARCLRRAPSRPPPSGRGQRSPRRRTVLRPPTSPPAPRPFSSEGASFRSAIDAARERVHGAAREATPDDEGDNTEPVDERS